MSVGCSTGQHRSQVLSSSTNLHCSVKSKRYTSTLAISQADDSGSMVIKSKWINIELTVSKVLQNLINVLF